MSKRRVVVTGLGILCPSGNNVNDSWQNIVNGKSGVDLITYFDTSNYETKFAASLKNFDSSSFLEKKEIRRTDLFIQYGLVAAEECVNDASLDTSSIDVSKIGVAIGSGIGGLQTIETNTILLNKRGPKKISPFFVPGSITNMVAGYVGIKFNFKGPNFSVSSACSSASHSIGYAYRSIVHGEADLMLTGGAEMAITPLAVAGFNAAKALSTNNNNPKEASRPWDKNRDGFVLGEGAGCLMLEEYDHAKKRGAKIYAEVIGFGMSNDAYHITAPPESGDGAILAMNNALKDAEVNPEEINYINAHGTSTPAGDIAENLAIKELFKEHSRNLIISSTKSMTGHLLGAAGAVEAIFSILAIRDKIAPPTINLLNPDKGCDLNYSPNQATKFDIKKSLSNSFGFGGTNATLVFSEL